MKKIVLGLLITVLFVGGCNSSKTNSQSSESSTVETSSKILEQLSVKQPSHSVEDGSFTISGTADPEAKVTYTVDNGKEQTAKLNTDGSFEISGDLPSNDQTYRFTDGISNSPVIVKSKASIEESKKNTEKEMAELEKQKAEEQKKKEEEEKKKQEEEKKQQEEQAKKEAEEEKQRQEEEQKRQEEEAIAKEKADKEKRISEAPRESKNALQKAYDYLDYSAFSKTGLYDQLIYEGFPEESAQFAIDNVETDWNKNALQKAKDYLDYSAFSDQGLYDQLVYEGFTAEQAQYAINNLPN